MPRAKRNEEPIPFSLPASLVSSIDSSPSTQRWLWIVGTLSNHITTQKEDEVDYNPHSYKPLDSRILIDILSTSYPKHIEKLKKEKIIEVELSEDGEESYDSVTGKAKRYRLCEKYREEIISDMVEIVELTNNTLIKNINESLIKKAEEVYEDHPWVREELSALDTLSFDKEEANKFYREVYEAKELSGKKINQKKLFNLDSNIYSLSQMFSKDKRLTRISIKNGRLFHPLTYCKRELRQFVTNSFDESVVEIDLKSAQFFFLCQARAIASKYSYKKNLLEGVLKHIQEPIKLNSHLTKGTAFGVFMEAVIEFDVYTEMSRIKVSTNYELRADEKDQKHVRDKVKLEFIKKVLYGYHTSYPKNIYEGKKPHELSLLENFYERYGPVMDFIKKIADECTRRKEDGSYSKSGCLAIILQNLEGFFFHHVVRERLQKEIGDFGYFIVHDAIYVDPDYEDDVRTLLVDITTEHFGRRLYFGGTDSSESEYLKMLTLCLTPEKQEELFEDMERYSGEDVELVISPVNNSWDSFTWDIKKK